MKESPLFSPKFPSGNNQSKDILKRQKKPNGSDDDDDDDVWFCS
jgi:hypothetical protein